MYMVSGEIFYNEIVRVFTATRVIEDVFFIFYAVQWAENDVVDILLYIIYIIVGVHAK